MFTCNNCQSSKDPPICTLGELLTKAGNPAPNGVFWRATPRKSSFPAGGRRCGTASERTGGPLCGLPGGRRSIAARCILRRAPCRPCVNCSLPCQSPQFPVAGGRRPLPGAEKLAAAGVDLVAVPDSGPPVVLLPVAEQDVFLRSDSAMADGPRRCPAGPDPSWRDIGCALLCLPAVDPDVLAGDPVGRRLAEQTDRGSDVFWRAEAVQR